MSSNNRDGVVCVGIDPGFDGAMAIVERTTHGLNLVSVYDLPTRVYCKATKGGKSSNRRAYDLPLLSRLVSQGKGANNFYVESNLILDTNSRFSTASTAFGCGIILGMTFVHGIDIEFCAPNMWQAWTNKCDIVAAERKRIKVNGKKPDSKQLAELFVKNQVRGTAGLLRTERGRLIDGRCDAICIASYCAEVTWQQQRVKNTCQ